MAVATVYGASMALLTGNAGGAIEGLPAANRSGGKNRTFKEIVALAAQAIGTVIGVARIRVPFELISISYLTDTSLGASTIALGDANSATAYHAAQTLTTTQQKVSPTGVTIAAFTSPVTAGYDCTTGNQVTPLAPGQGGAGYEDFVLTVAAANLPGAGNLMVFIDVAYE